MNPNAYLVLEDADYWPGYSFGCPPPTAADLSAAPGTAACAGEVIFNTGMTGYHEILTDPSYTGQIVMMTYPHIGNVGCTDDWSEIGPESGRLQARGIKASGLVLRSVYHGPTPDGRIGIGEFLAQHGVCGISEVDTRGLTLKIRKTGSQNGMILASSSTDGPTKTELQAALKYLERIPDMNGLNLIGEAGTLKTETVNPEGSPHVVLLDCGVKRGIIEELVDRGCRVTILPADSDAASVRAVKSDALLFSNGPGDPSPLESQVNLAKNLMGDLPLWGICLGHQILAKAVGGSTYKMRFGHHGLNHPVRDEKTNRVFVTSQNHGFAVNEDSLPEGFTVRFRNANDGSVEGFENQELRLISIQHHPEAKPGPSDSSWVFDSFMETLD